MIAVHRYILCDLWLACVTCCTGGGGVQKYSVKGTTSVTLSLSNRWSLTHMRVERRYVESTLLNVGRLGGVHTWIVTKLDLFGGRVICVGRSQAG